MSEEPPKKCPVLDKCKELVTKDVYEALCKSGAWIHCRHVPLELRNQYKKRPKEWEELERDE